tara:strand:- start:69 stop:209 length:141 start_codon:yes stop_codon:yes gene_type:complete
MEGTKGIFDQINKIKRESIFLKHDTPKNFFIKGDYTLFKKSPLTIV